MLKITSISIASNSIREFNGIMFPRLEFLGVNGNCLDIGQVVNLPDLKYAGLHDQIPNKKINSQSRSDIGNHRIFNRVRHVKLSGVQLESISLSLDSRVIHMDLSWSNIVHIPHCLSILTCIQQLELQGNNLSDLRPLYPLVNLLKLNLSSNMIKSVTTICGLLKHIPKLSHLDTTNNPFNTPDTNFSDQDAAYVLQICYNGAIISAGKSIRVLDNERLTCHDRKKAIKRLKTVEDYCKAHLGKNAISNQDSITDWQPKCFALQDMTVDDRIVIQNLSFAR